MTKSQPAHSEPNDLEAIDRSIGEDMAEARHHPAIRWLGWLSEIADQPQLASLCGLTALIGLARRDERLAATGLQMLGAHALATFVKSCLKRAINRTRPKVALEEGRYEMGLGTSRDGDDQSFPSGHTAGAVAVAGVVAVRYPQAALPACALALGVSAIQVPRGKHYPGDLAAGLAIGVLASGLVLAVSRAVRDRP